MGMKRLPILITLVIVLGVAACTRSATPSAVEGTLPFPVPETDDAMRDILEGGFATQTAVARGEGAQAEPSPTVEPTETQPAPTAAPTNTPVATQETQTTTAQCESPYTVKAGEWIYSIGRKCGIDPQAIINANTSLRPPYLLYPGDKLTLPANGGTPTGGTPTGGTSNCGSSYTVSLGEWVYSIARKCGVTAEGIISANSLGFPYTIFPGQSLTIP